MAKQLTFAAYTFDELSDKAKDKARQWMRESLGANTDWADSIIDDAKQAGVFLPEWDADSGTASVHCPDVERTVDYILANHGSECDTHKAAKAYRDAMGAIPDTGQDEDEQERTDAAMNILHDELGRCYGNALRAEMEYMFYGEGLDDTIEANSYLFSEDGSRTVTLNA